MNRAYQGVAMLLLAAFCAGQDMSQDPCMKSMYTTLKEPYRNTGYDHRSTDTPLCDNKLRKGWYTFVDPNNDPIQMATSCPGRNTCGTVTPYWLNGTHPATTETGNLQRCKSGTWSETDLQPCRDLYPILTTQPEVKGPFVNDNQTFEFMCQIVYAKTEGDARFEVTWTFDGRPDPNIKSIILEGTGRAASLDAKQLQNHLDQEIGCQVTSYYEARKQDKSKQISSRNSVYFGIKEQPEIVGPNVRDKTFDLQCRVTFGDYDSDQQIEVVWTFDGKADTPQVLTGNRRSITLDGAAVLSHINENIACQARLIYANEVRTAFRKSIDYYFGITVNPTNFAIETSDTEKEVTITSNVPIICDEDQNCCVTFKLKVDKKAVVSFKDTCEHKICSADWDPQKRSASVKISVVPIRNQIKDGTKKTTLTIDTLTSGTGQYMNIFRKNKFQQVSVTVTIKGGFSCSFTGDPHVVGLDYRHSYHFYTVGEYTAYTVSDRNFTIQIKTWKCWSVTCVCGVAVREQNDIIRVYGCDKPNNLFASVIKIPYKLSQGTSVMRSQNGHHIGITLPSGSEVKIDITQIYMNVYINTPGIDLNKARGVCGTNDGIANNDFTHLNGYVTPVCAQPGNCQPQAFIDSWRVTGDKSLFVKDPPHTKVETAQKYCLCDSSQPSATCSSSQHSRNTAAVCNGCMKITDMLKPEPRDSLITIAVNSDKQWSSDDDVSGDEANNERRRRASNEAVTEVIMKWPNSQGVTEDQAMDMCRNSISSAQLFSQCGNDNTMMNNSMSDCLNDILFGETKETVDLMPATFTTQCQQMMATDENNYEEVDGFLLMKKTLVDFVCPAECREHGTCGADGKCDCHANWEGDACHIELGKGPQIRWTNNGSMCYANNKFCDSVNLDVSNANLLDKLSCQVYTLDKLDNNQGNPVISEAVRDGSPEAKCFLPQTGASTLNFTVSVSRDGQIYGNELRVNTFDSTCLSCTDTGCTELKIACHINNICYTHGERNKNNAELICDVNKHTSAWSEAPANSGRTATSLHPWMNILAVLQIGFSAWETIKSLF
ncbi:hypothetical protein BsWGS_09802 [Bradybaena similaris]